MILTLKYHSDNKIYLKYQYNVFFTNSVCETSVCETKLKTLQKLQNRAARIVTGSPFDTPGAPLLQRLGWPSIDKLFNRETCTMVFKSLNDLAPENLGNIFSKLSDVHARVLRNTKCNLALPKMRTAYGQKSFAFRGANAWNKLDS